MSASLLPPPLLQFADANGAPYAGGSLATYLPGTLTLATTYSDSLGTIQNTNPIILDGAGRCAMWATGSIRCILNDALGNQIFDQVSTAPASGTGALVAANNLSDLVNIPTARANLGLGSAALASLGTAGATVPENNSANIFSAFQTLGAGGLITPRAAPLAADIGYMGIPQSLRGGAYALTMADLATELFFSATATLTVPANTALAVPVGHFIVATWDATFTGTIQVTTDTLRWVVGNVLGARTVTGPGYAVLRKMKLTEWWCISGANVS